jgi:integrase
MTRHSIFGGEVQIYRRGGKFWNCSASVDGKQFRETTKERDLALAKEKAEDWYLTLRGKARAGILRSDKTFAEAAKKFSAEYETLNEGQRSPKWVQGHQDRLRLHLLPFFGKMGLGDITQDTAQEYRVHRITTTKAKTATPATEDSPAVPGKPPAQKTLHNEIVTLRLVLKCAHRAKWIPFVPDLSPPYRGSTKISHRPWFTPEEYKMLYEATRARAKNPFHERHREDSEDLHDFILLMANSGLRPDEAKHLEPRDVKVIYDETTRADILEIYVPSRGKRGTGVCKTMPGAVLPFKRIVERHNLGPTDKLFPKNHDTQFNNILKEIGLKFDRDGKPRTLYSLRHSYICFRLLEGADIYAIAKNCRTSVEMIQKHYAAHLKTSIDTSVINVRREKPKKRKPSPPKATQANPD